MEPIWPAHFEVFEDRKEINCPHVEIEVIDGYSGEQRNSLGYFVDVDVEVVRCVKCNATWTE